MVFLGNLPVFTLVLTSDSQHFCVPTTETLPMGDYPAIGDHGTPKTPSFNWACYQYQSHIHIPVVPHKAAAEVSKIANYRTGALLWCMDGRASLLMHRKMAEALSLFFSLCYLLSVSLCYPPLRLSISPSVYLSVHLSIHLSNYLSIYPSLYLALYLFAYLSTYVPTLHICLSLYLSICLSVYLSIHPSIHLFIYISEREQFCETSFKTASIYECINLAIYQPFNLSIYLSIHLSFYPFFWN